MRSDFHIDRETLERTLAILRRNLLAARTADGHWVGELSSSALSTATASFALHCVDPQRFASHIAAGLRWIVEHANADGGWGDSADSLSNIATTLLCWSALSIAPQAPAAMTAIRSAETWLARKAGSLKPGDLAKSLATRYGRDRSFSAPILTMCALAGRLGNGEAAWQHVAALPFELAAFPHHWWRFLRLPVVSYALPALIAIGQARHHFRPTRNPLARLIRNGVARRTLDKLAAIQPPSGGFLEAAPLTSFVVMCLAAIGRDRPLPDSGQAVVRRGCEFLTATVRPDGSWPIDTNLATWVTTLSINALAAGGKLAELNDADRRGLADWLIGQQLRVEHPYTHAPPGGWAWTDLSGGVPDADDTAGSLLAIRRLVEHDQGANREAVQEAVKAGITWLLDIQNRDGGVPTFCRGWGKLPFDRSAADLTAHALAAWRAWRDQLPPALAGRTTDAIARALRYLDRAQRPDGSWLPLWFGNQHQANEENPTYGTARVVIALASLTDSTKDAITTSSSQDAQSSAEIPLECGGCDAALAASGQAKAASRPPHSIKDPPFSERPLASGLRWLLAAQNDDGGWGGAKGLASTIEETAVALDALACVARTQQPGDAVFEAIRRGANWLIERVGSGDTLPATPIGLYFARLWYSEKLYPLIFALSALERVRRLDS